MISGLYKGICDSLGVFKGISEGSDSHKWARMEPSYHIIQGIDALSHKNPCYITSPSLTFKHSETVLKCISLYCNII